MVRPVHPTPRHLDDPVQLGPLTPAQWLVALIATVLVWLVLTHLTIIPVMWRIALGAPLIGVTLGLTESGYGGSLTERPRRAWHTLTAPREWASGPPRHGPLALTLVELQPSDEEGPDA